MYGTGIESYNPKGISYLMRLAEEKPEKRSAIRLRALTELYMSGNAKLIKELNRDLNEYLEKTIGAVQDLKDDDLIDPNFNLIMLDDVAKCHKIFEDEDTTLGYEAIKKYEGLDYILDKAYLLYCALNQKKENYDIIIQII